MAAEGTPKRAPHGTENPKQTALDFNARAVYSAYEQPRLSRQSQIQEHGDCTHRRRTLAAEALHLVGEVVRA